MAAALGQTGRFFQWGTDGRRELKTRLCRGRSWSGSTQEAEGEGRSLRPPLVQPPARWPSSSLSGVSPVASGCWLDAGRPELLTLLPRADCASLSARLLARPRPGASAPWKWAVSHRPPAPRARGQQRLWSLWFWGLFFCILFLDNLRRCVDPKIKLT